MKSKPSIFASLWLMVLLIGLTILPIARAQESLIPVPTGSYPVGTVTRHWIDTSREEKLTPDEGDQRELIVQFWYPAEVEGDGNTAAYISNPEIILPPLEGALRDAGIKITIPSADFVGWQSHAFVDAPLAENEKTYPVLVFSPGWGGVPQIYTTQLEELVSQGYIVAAIDFPYISSATLLPDGRTAMFAETTFHLAFSVVTQDQIFTLDQLEILNADDPDGIFTNRLDLDHIGVFGHSLGGAAAAQTCYLDTRCKAGVNEDGTLFGEVVVESVDQPFLFFSNQHSSFTIGLTYKEARGPVYDLQIMGAEHLSFTDAPLWPDPALTASQWRGSIEPERSVHLTRTYLLAFFDQYLKGKPNELLNGASPDYPEVIINMRNT